MNYEVVQIRYITALFGEFFSRVFFFGCLLLGWLVALPTDTCNCLFPHLFKVRSSCELKTSNSILFFESLYLVLLFICGNFVFMTRAWVVHDAITIRNASSFVFIIPSVYRQMSIPSICMLFYLNLSCNQYRFPSRSYCLLSSVKLRHK